MLNKLLTMVRRYEMISPGDRVICAVSGGADSMALLWGMYLLRQKLGITLEAAHFNHGLRGEESQRDEAFVRGFCRDYGIPLTVAGGEVVPGKKGLEAAARDARYGFLETLPGKVATAHTADDNAETVLMHLVRGTGLTGLGGIAPVRGKLIRPMLLVTREQVLHFLQEYHIPWVEDSSNQGDQFLRNRLRHRVVPVLKEENPKLAENLSAMAMHLRADAAALEAQSREETWLDVKTLREMCPARRNRVLGAFLKSAGVREPEADHIALAEKLVFSEKPSARGDFPGDVTISRNYDRLERGRPAEALAPQVLPCPGAVELPQIGLRIVCTPGDGRGQGPGAFTVYPKGEITVRCREPGDTMRLPGGTKSLKKLFIDRKIPAAQRQAIPVLADAAGVLGVYGLGANLDRVTGAPPAVEIQFEHIITSNG